MTFRPIRHLAIVTFGVVGATTLLSGPASAGEGFDLKVRRHGAATYQGGGVFIPSCDPETPSAMRKLKVGQEGRFDVAIKRTGDDSDVVVDLALSSNPQGTFKVRYFRNGNNITDQFEGGLELTLQPGQQKRFEVRIKVKSGSPGNTISNCYRDNAASDRVWVRVEVK